MIRCPKWKPKPVVIFEQELQVSNGQQNEITGIWFYEIHKQSGYQTPEYQTLKNTVFKL